MPKKNESRVVSLVESAVNDTFSQVPQRATMLGISAQNFIVARLNSGLVLECEVLQSFGSIDSLLQNGDVLLVLPPTDDARGIVLGRIGKYQPKVVQEDVVIEAGERLTLRCGEASVDLRADGKVTIRGEDVLVRAKGTQRIRAGTVSIN